MTDREVTIVVVPRERFSCSQRSLESIYAHTDFPFSLVYVDGGSPARIRRYLARKAREHHFKLIRTNHYLTPNQARNLGVQEVKSKYVVFVDNDVIVTPGWLTSLVGCAEETGAWMVGPLILIGELGSTTIHFAGGTAHIKESQGKRGFHVGHAFLGESLTDVGSALRPQPSELVEFHCVLMLTEAYRRVGPFDERLLSVHEHEDISLGVHERGGTLYFEPRSVITYIPPPPISWFDLPYFMLRWSDAWNSASHNHFENKWGLRDKDNSMSVARHFTRGQRWTCMVPVRSAVRRISRICGWQPDNIEQSFLFPAEQQVNRCLVRLLSKDGHDRDVQL